MMQVITSDRRSRKVLDYLRRRLSDETIEAGIELARSGAVVEVGRCGFVISGIVHNSSDRSSCACQLTLESHSELISHCSCREMDSTEQLEEGAGWCLHCVALLWIASELELFSKDAGFHREHPLNPRTTSIVHNVSEVVRDLTSFSEFQVTATQSASHPSVVVELDHSSDRLGVRILFDGEVQTPKVFDFLYRYSSRELDNLLIDLLEEYGSWDEHHALWYVNSSREIERLLGLLTEYEHVKSIKSNKRVIFSQSHLDGVLILEWHDSNLTLWMEWVLPDRSRRQREEAIFGTGPHWVVLDNHLYKLTSRAVRIASLFPLSSSLTIPVERTGPILEFLEESTSNIEVRNRDLQPEAQLVSPIPHLALSLRPVPREASSHTPDELELHGVLSFIYPEPEDKVVYLPHHQREKELSKTLLDHGFLFDSTAQRYIATGDAALDFVYKPSCSLPEGWNIEGLQHIQKEIRFSELILNLSIMKSQDTNLGDESSSFDCTVLLFQNGANIPISSLFKTSSKLSDRWLKLDGGSYARVPGGSLTRLKSSLGIIDSNLSLSNSLRRRISVTQALSLTSSNDHQVVFSLDDKIKRLRDSLDSFSTIKPSTPRKGFKGQLRAYQKESVGWLKFLHEFGLSGILADEMGLGKTVQTLAFLQFLRNSRKEIFAFNKPALIVAPTSVVTNWHYEIRSFTPELKSLVLHGPNRKQLFKDIPDYDIIITSYSLIRMDRTELSKFSFSYLILDEAQNIKNPAAHTTKSVKVLKADHRLALTGTPTENRPQELWSIFDFLMPGYLGSLQSFKSTFEKAILEQGPGSEPGVLLRDKIRPFILRRTKAEVEKELPPKVESLVFAEMLPQQQTLYTEFLSEIRPKLFEEVAQKGIRGASIPILSALLRLRQVCNHPASIKGFDEIGDWNSGKFDALKELVQEAFDSNRKILLFSQFRSMLQIIRTWIDTTKTPYLYLDGLTKDRQALVDRFNADDSIRMFLISLKAGGSGLNLTGADTVILYDPWWNPAVEAQAVDRAHRIGQKRSVNVYRLVTANSIEEKMIRLKEKKSEIVDSLIEGAGTTSLSLSKSDLEDLLSLPQW